MKYRVFIRALKPRESVNCSGLSIIDASPLFLHYNSIITPILQWSEAVHEFRTQATLVLQSQVENETAITPRFLYAVNTVFILRILVM